MLGEPVSRRQFVQEGTVAAAAASLAVGLAPIPTVHAGNPQKLDTSKILNYCPTMEYRRCGKTNLMVSCVCLGGHWKRVDKMVPGLFQKGSWLSAKLDDKKFEDNRTDVVSRCIDRGVNYIDACTGAEVIMYAKALKGRREKMYLGYSWYEREMRGLGGKWQKAKADGKPMPAGWITQQLKDSLDEKLKETGLGYVDLWRITCNEKSSRHGEDELQEMIAALEWAKKSGRARFTGISSHDRTHIKTMIEKYPAQMEVIVTPYTAKSKLVEDETGLWAAMKKHDVGWFGIKPFASGSLFKGDSSRGNPQEKQDNEAARLALRYILCNPVITAPIPGMISEEQVDNAAVAVMERRKLDEGEQARLDAMMNETWANLPHHYQWLKDWEYV